MRMRSAERERRAGPGNVPVRPGTRPTARTRRRDSAFRIPRSALAAALVFLAAPARARGQQLPPLPDSTGWGLHVLTIARAPDSSIWVGTYGQGIFVLRAGAWKRERSAWKQMRFSPDSAAHSISWDFVHAFGFGPRGEIWYGTVGNGWGLSTDGGRTWRNWEFSDLGPEWQYVTPNGIVVRGDTTYIATADGVQVTWDDGATWRVITDSIGATTARDSVLGTIRNQYVLAMTLGTGDALWVATLHGLEVSADGGRHWKPVDEPAALAFPNRVRTLLVDSRGAVWIGGLGSLWARAPGVGRWIDIDSLEDCAGVRKRCRPHRAVVERLIERRDSVEVLELGGRRVVPLRDVAEAERGGEGRGTVSVDTSFAYVTRGAAGARSSPWLRLGLPPVLWDAETPGAGHVESLRHTWFDRPIALTDQPYIDQTYRFGSTMGGNFQPHQGVEFNNPDGTPVHAIGDGVVVYAGPAEAGANTVAMRHRRRLSVDGERRYLFSVYYHNTRLLVHAGQTVRAGDVIALVGNTGRATNDHVHLEIHVAPTADSGRIVDPAVRYPPFNVNPELWIAPLPGTGVVAGQVWDSAGVAVPQARIYGLVKPEPEETPFSFIETYGPRNHADPVYHEHFAISDVPPGEYVLGVEIDGRRVYRRVTVRAGRLTWVRFRP